MGQCYKLPKKNAPYVIDAWLLAAFTIAAKSGSTIKVTVQTQDANGQNVKQSVSLKAYLATLATGQVLATAPSGNVAIAAKGVILDNQGSGQVIDVVTNSSGVFDLNIINSGSANYYMILCAPDGSIVASPVIAF